MGKTYTPNFATPSYDRTLAQRQREALTSVAAAQGYASAVLTAAELGQTYDVVEVARRIHDELSAALAASHGPQSIHDITVPAHLGITGWVREVFAWRHAVSITVLSEEEADELIGANDYPEGTCVVDVSAPLTRDVQRYVVGNFPKHAGELAAYPFDVCPLCRTREACGDALAHGNDYHGLDAYCVPCLPQAWSDWEPSAAQLDAYIERVYGAWG